MPYDSISAAKEAGFPTTAGGASLTLSQINKLASIYDAVKAAGTVDNPMAVAWTQWKKLYHKSGDGWAANATEVKPPDGYESSILSFHQPKQLSYTDDQTTGDTIFHDVVLLAEGTWTDGYNRKPIHYSGHELSKMTIEKRTFKASHDIFDSLPITNEIGIIENERFMQHPTPRWVGDVRVYPTQNGKDITMLLKRGAFKAISSELYTLHEKSKERTNATDIIFMGAASVRTGACSVCTFNEGESPGVTGTEKTIGVENLTTEDGGATASATDSSDHGADEAVLKAELESEKTADINALEAQLEEAKKMKKYQLAAELSAANMRISELEAENRKLTNQIADMEHKSKAAELQRQIEELKRQPVMYTKVESHHAAHSAPSELDTGDFEAVYASDME